MSKVNPITIPKPSSSSSKNDDYGYIAPFSPPVDGNFDFSGFLHYKRQNDQKLANDNEYDFNSNISLTTDKNNQQQPQISTRMQSMLKISNSESTSSTETSPFTLRKQQQQQNSDLLNKMLEIAFKDQHQQQKPAEKPDISDKDSSKLFKKYRDLNTMVPDSL